MMNTTQNNNRNYLRFSKDLNPCPECGYPAYELETDFSQHYVGCIHCGLHKAVTNSTLEREDLVEENKIRSRREWNEYCLNTYCGEQMLDVVLGIKNGEYAIVDNQTKEIVHVVPSMEDAKNFIVYNDLVSFSLYVNI